MSADVGRRLIWRFGLRSMARAGPEVIRPREERLGRLGRAWLEFWRSEITSALTLWQERAIPREYEFDYATVKERQEETSTGDEACDVTECANTTKTLKTACRPALLHLGGTEGRVRPARNQADAYPSLVGRLQCLHAHGDAQRAKKVRARNVVRPFEQVLIGSCAPLPRTQDRHTNNSMSRVICPQLFEQRWDGVISPACEIRHLGGRHLCPHVILVGN
ncbi:hypothetical protein BCR34DRAFT_292385 [Clohesyomyces aquaticus]|uniref:Uncharacterized protein n=1 Tax=Clohesyomyces aquaticus TaxID=1231657 RepID=A0A1Y2A871_9PLEO|nr:hypothetical protein BCR34DRAFT_292385 [Clohesyomyces aquaticus]